MVHGGRALRDSTGAGTGTGRIPRLWIVAAVVFAALLALGIVMWRSVLAGEEERAIRRHQMVP